MNILEEIQNCPVECKELGEVVHSIKTGLNPRKFFQLNPTDATNYYITVREIRGHKIVPSEKTDLINNEGLILCQNRSNLESGDVLFTGTGTIGNVAIIEETPTNWNIKEGVYSIKPKKEIICSKFLMYIFESERVRKDIEGRKAGGTVKSISMTEMKKIKIPIPPLEIQEKIVQILDKMTEYVTELTSELTSRKKQYSFYRDKLLSFEDEVYQVEWKTLGEVATVTKLAGYEFTKYVNYSSTGEIIALRALNVKKGRLVLDDVKYIDNSEFSKLNRSKLQIGDMLFTYVGTVGEVALIDKDDTYYLAPNVAMVRLNTNTIIAKYLMYYCQSNVFVYNQIERLMEASSMKNLTMEKIRKFKIPIPSLEIQSRIVQVLDNFDKVCNDLNIGLPKEIELRQKQYEYFREKLLTFVAEGEYTDSTVQTRHH